jgi:hypothetical protein
MFFCCRYHLELCSSVAAATLNYVLLVAAATLKSCLFVATAILNYAQNGAIGNDLHTTIHFAASHAPLPSAMRSPR